MIDPSATIDEILAKAREMTTLTIFEGGVPDGYTHELIPGSNQIKPYVIMDFAGITQSQKGQGITGAADDSYDEGFSSHSVASTKDTARRVNSMVLRKLLGFTPTYCGEIRPAFFGGIGESSNLSDPSRYSAAQAYRLLLNPRI